MTGYKKPPRRKTDVSHITVCDAIQTLLISRYDQLGTWKAVGAEIGVSPAMAQRVATTAYRPKNEAVRVKLGLPILKPAPACVSCGEVHVRKTCPAARKPRAPRTGPTPRQRRWLQIMGILWGGEGPPPRKR